MANNTQPQDIPEQQAVYFPQHPVANEQQQASSEHHEAIADTIQFHASDYTITIQNPDRTFTNPPLPPDSPALSTASVMENKSVFPPSSPVFSMCSESMKSNNQANNCQSNPDEHRVHLHATMPIEDHGHQLLLEEVASR